MLEDLVFGRMSFQGFNPEVEVCYPIRGAVEGQVYVLSLLEVDGTLCGTTRRKAGQSREQRHEKGRDR